VKLEIYDNDDDDKGVVVYLSWFNLLVQLLSFLLLPLFICRSSLSLFLLSNQSDISQSQCSMGCSSSVLQYTRSPAVARVSNLYCLCQKASVRLLVAKRKRFPRWL